MTALTVEMVEEWRNILKVDVTPGRSAVMDALCDAALAPLRGGSGEGTRNVVLKAQSILAEYIVPDSGISDHECICRLLGLLDGPESRAALATPSAAPVEDGVRVPREPTDSMVKAGVSALICNGADPDCCEGDVMDVWCAMLSARPGEAE